MSSDLAWGGIILLILVIYALHVSRLEYKLRRRTVAINRLILELRHRGIKVRLLKDGPATSPVLSLENIVPTDPEHKERALRNQHNERILTDTNGHSKQDWPNRWGGITYDGEI